MPLTSRLRQQDGFIRELLITALIIAIVAVAILDAMSVFNANQSVKDDTQTAAKEARTEYAQSLNVEAAKLAAEQSVISSGMTLVSVTSAKQGSEGTPVFTVTAKTTADTFVFKFLKAIPQLKSWVQRSTHPQATATSH